MSWTRTGANPKEYLKGIEFFKHLCTFRYHHKLKQLKDKEKAMRAIMIWTESSMALYFGLLDGLVVHIKSEYKGSEETKHFNVIAAQLSSWEKILINHCHFHRYASTFDNLVKNKHVFTSGVDERIIYDDNIDDMLEDFVDSGSQIPG